MASLSERNKTRRNAETIQSEMAVDIREQLMNKSSSKVKGGPEDADGQSNSSLDAASDCACPEEDAGECKRSDCDCPEESQAAIKPDSSYPEEGEKGSEKINRHGPEYAKGRKIRKTRNVMPEFCHARFVSTNAKARMYEMLEMKRCAEKKIENHLPALLTNQFQILGRDEIPVQTPPFEAWQIRHRRNQELVATPSRYGVTLPYVHALPPIMFVPMATFPTKVCCGAFFDWNTEHRRTKLTLQPVTREGENFLRK